MPPIYRSYRDGFGNLAAIHSRKDVCITAPLSVLMNELNENSSFHAHTLKSGRMIGFVLL
jgi:hypothetical protein